MFPPKKPTIRIKMQEITPQILRSCTKKENDQLILDEKEKKYAVQSKLGDGTFSQIYLIKDMETRVPFALKVIDYKRIRNEFPQTQSQKIIQLVRRQYTLLSCCDSPFVVKCYQAFENQDCYGIVLEYCNGKTLKEILIENDYCLDEITAIKIIKHILCGLKQLSDSKIVHRDLTLENIIESNRYFKIIDLGLGKHIKDSKENQNHSIVGTKSMMAPQTIQRRPYGIKIDIYSLGLILLKIVVKNYPFCQRVPSILDKKLLNSKGKPLNEVIVDFIRKTLKEKPEQRFSAQQLIFHNLIKDQFQQVSQKSLPQDSDDQKTQPQVYSRPRTYQSSFSQESILPHKSKGITQDFDVILMGKKAEFIIRLIQLIERESKKICKNENGIKLLFLFSRKAYAFMLKVWQFFYNSSQSCIQIGWRAIQENLNDSSLKQTKYNKLMQKKMNSKTNQLKTFFCKFFTQKEFSIKKKQLTILYSTEGPNFKQDEWMLTDYYITKVIDLLPKKDDSLLKRSLQGYHQIVTMSVHEQGFDEMVNQILRINQN